MDTKYLAGVGSRSTPAYVIPSIEYFAKEFISFGETLRSGGATGADTFWENAFDKFSGQKEIYLPRPFFNKNPSPLYGISEAAKDIARKHHPKFDDQTPFVQELLARNVFILLGTDLKTPAEHLIFWSPDTEGIVSGGTGHAVRIAKTYKIPAYNLAEKRDVEMLRLLIKFRNQFG
jgi:hypothetical protein